MNEFEPDLLPCPFCGSKQQTYDNCDHGSGKWYLCNGCGVQVKVPYGVDLKSAWNRRAPELLITVENG